MIGHLGYILILAIAIGIHICLRNLKQIAYSNKIHCPFRIKTLKILGMEGICLNIWKVVYRWQIYYHHYVK